MNVKSESEVAQLCPTLRDEATKARIDRLHKLNEFKLKPIPYFPYLCEPAD